MHSARRIFQEGKIKKPIFFSYHAEKTADQIEPSIRLDIPFQVAKLAFSVDKLRDFFSKGRTRRNKIIDELTRHSFEAVLQEPEAIDEVVRDIVLKSRCLRRK